WLTKIADIKDKRGLLKSTVQGEDVQQPLRARTTTLVFDLGSKELHLSDQCTALSGFRVADAMMVLYFALGSTGLPGKDEIAEYLRQLFERKRQLELPRYFWFAICAGSQKTVGLGAGFPEAILTSSAVLRQLCSTADDTVVSGTLPGSGIVVEACLTNYEEGS